MKTHRLQNGLTLVEILVAVAIVAVLASIVLTTLTRIGSKSKEQLCEGTLDILNTALRQYRDYEWQLNLATTIDANEMEFYRSLKFPPDCNDFDIIGIQNTLDDMLDPQIATMITVTNAADHLDEYSGCEVMYFFLSRLPECREILEKMNETVLTNIDNTGNRMTINIDGRQYGLIRVVDPWGRTLRYDYYSNKKEDPGLRFNQRSQTIRNFPQITSAGPDGIFDTSDDITNREKTKGATYQP